MNKQALQDYEAMWLEDRDSYVLRDRGDGTYSIVDLRDNAGVIIEDVSVAREVVHRMLAAGVQVGDPFDPKFRKQLASSRLKRGAE